MNQLITILISASIPSALTGFFFWLLEKRISDKSQAELAARQKCENAAIERAKDRTAFQMCIVNSVKSALTVCEATARAVQRIPDAHCNGDMHSALDSAEKSQNDLDQFLQKIAVEKFSKGDEF